MIAGYFKYREVQAKKKRGEALDRLGIARDGLRILTTAIETVEKAQSKDENPIKRIVENVSKIPGVAGAAREIEDTLEMVKIEQFMRSERAKRKVAPR